MFNVYLAVVGAIGVGLAFVSKRIRDVPVSEPLIAMVVGALIGPEVAGWVDLGGDGMMKVLLEASRILLAVSLIGIGLRYPVGALRPRVAPVALLLAVVMPGMAAVSALLGWWLIGVPAALAWLIGACVAPTDPVLASSVVTGESARRLVPARLRQLLSMESGANDGLALPLVLLGITLVTGGSLGQWGWRSVWTICGAVVVGAVIGWLAGHAMRSAKQRGDIDSSEMVLFTVVLAILVLGAAKLANTDGILAVFVAGLLYNGVVSGRERSFEVTIDEGFNRFLVLPLFVLLGVALPWSTWTDMGWPVVAFALAVLALRRLPWIAALRRPLRFDWPSTAYYGWFGPIGASALFYLALAHEEGVTDERLFGAGTMVIALSVVAHGISAAPGRRRFAAAERRQRQGADR